MVNVSVMIIIMKYIFIFLTISFCVCIHSFISSDVHKYLHVDYVLDTVICIQSFTSVSFKDCVDAFLSGEYSSNVMVYKRHYLLCNLCFVLETLETKEEPGSILYYLPSAGIALNNVAEGKPSSQSSTYKKLRNGIDVYATSDLAVDGIWDSNMSRYDDRFMCSHTDWGSPGEHWWMVNLEQTYRICKVVILNRGDWRWDRLRDLTIAVGANPNAMSLCNEYGGPGRRGENVAINCRNLLLGQYVRISKPFATDVLQLCEVAVYSLL